MTSLRPPFDPSLIHLAPNTGEGSANGTETWPIADPEKVAQIRELGDKALDATEQLFSDASLTTEQVTIPGPHGDLPLVVLYPKANGAATSAKRPGIFYIHGGGMIAGIALSGLSVVIDWVKRLDAVAVTVEYRRAPESKGQALTEECYAGLSWFAEQFDRLGVDTERLAITGMSAGGGLAAATALMARDRGSPKICAQLLACPMLDDRNNTVSASKQYYKVGGYTGELNEFCWSCLLGDRRGTENVSAYESPARATDLAGLPSAFIDVGSAEPFRDEAVLYASRLWESGVQAELHVWAGGPHGFEVLAPEADVSRQALEARFKWLQRTLEEKRLN